MSKPEKKIKPQKKFSGKKSPDSAARAKTPVKSLERHAKSWVVIGFDTSMSSLAGAALGYDDVLKKFQGPSFTMTRWSKLDHYYDRLEKCARAHTVVLDLLSGLRMVVPLDRIFIAVEEPWPYRMARGGHSAFLKQQAEISGAFLGGLLRYGYREVYQIGSDKWRGVIRDQLIEDGKEGPSFTTHHTKWNSPKLASQYNATLKDSGKFRAVQWAKDVYEPGWYQTTGVPIPAWPDIIESTKLGKIPRPENSKAKSVQPDDRYDALAMCEWMRLELHEMGVV